jgi:Ca2+-binding RTX toxin-like protein
VEIIGPQRSDHITGTSSDDHIRAGDGNDRVRGLAGDDLIEGRGGDDRLFGDKGVDFLDGGDGNDVMEGGDGGDTLVGGEGNDRLYGSGGDDFHVGGLGRDVFGFVVTGSGGARSDVIADFQTGVDAVALGSERDAVLGLLDSNGNGVINNADEHVQRTSGDLVLRVDAITGQESALTLFDVESLVLDDFVA